MLKSWIKILGALCFVACMASLEAQTIIRTTSGTTVMVPGRVPTLNDIPWPNMSSAQPTIVNGTTTANQESGATTPPTPDEDDLRLQKITQLTFDRRGSTILKALTDANKPEPAKAGQVTSEPSANKIIPPLLQPNRMLKRRQGKQPN